MKPFYFHSALEEELGPLEERVLEAVWERKTTTARELIQRQVLRAGVRLGRLFFYFGDEFTDRLFILCTHVRELDPLSVLFCPDDCAHCLEPRS